MTSDETGSSRGSLAPRWRDLSVRRKGLIVVALPVTALIVAVVMFVVVDDQNRKAGDGVERTLQVQRAVDDVLVLVVDAETSGRGYVLTGDAQFLEPLDAARQLLPGSLDRLRDLVVDDNVQRNRVDALAGLVDRRLDISERTVGFGPADVSSNEIVDLLGEGKAVTDAIRADVDEIMVTEDERLTELRAEADDAQRRGRVAMVVALLAGLVGGVAATVLHSRGVSRRLAAVRRDAELLARGEPPGPMPEGNDEIGMLAHSLRTARFELEQREAALRASRTELQAILDASPDTILVFDVDGTVLSVNSAIFGALGHTESSRLGHAAADVIHADDIDRFHEALRRAVDVPEERISLRYRVRHGDGRWIDIEARGQSFIDARTGRGNVLIVSRDISAQVALERAELQAREEAVAANQAKSQFLSHMSHELRTPLNAVLGFAQVLELDDLTEDQREAVDHILKGGRHLLSLINEVLDLSRIDSGEMSLSPEPVLMGDLVTDALQLIVPLAAQRDITVRTSSTCEVYALADRQRTQQVLLNLLSNAVKYNRQAGTVTLACECDATHVRVSVADTGYGIGPEHVDLLFTPFERLGQRQSEIEGTGIGLALSRRLTDAMGGTIALTHTSGHGSTFTLELPLVEGPTDRHDRLTTHAYDGWSPAPRRAVDHTIVHVEDNLPNLELVERILESRTDIRIVPAMQGRLALDLVREHRPSLVLLDLHLADVNGDEILRQIVADPATASIPVVILSADATQRQVQRLLAAGAHSYLTKPIDVRRLVATIDAILAAESHP